MCVVSGGGGGSPGLIFLSICVTSTLTKSHALLNAPVISGTKLFMKCCLKRCQEDFFQKFVLNLYNLYLRLRNFGKNTSIHV